MGSFKMSAPMADSKGDGICEENAKGYPIGATLNRVIPYAGGASALAFSLNVMIPGLYKGWFSPYDLSVSNCLWFNSHLGTGLYIYNQPVISRASPFKRIAYSVFGAMILNFGTVLFWATTKLILPKNNAIRCLFGVGSGFAMLYLGQDFLKFVDSNKS